MIKIPTRTQKETITKKGVVKEKKKGDVSPGTIHLSSLQRKKKRILIIDRSITKELVDRGLRLTPNKKNFDHGRIDVSLAFSGDNIFLFFPERYARFPHYYRTIMHNFTVPIPTTLENFIRQRLEEEKMLSPRHLSTFRLQFNYILITPKEFLIFVIPLNTAKVVKE